jgi:hypothetical protein
MATKKLPGAVYVVRNTDSDGSDFLLADTDLPALVRSADAEPAIVGIYQLLETCKYRESVEEVK